MTHRDRFVGRLAGERIEDRDQLILQEASDREVRLDAARVDASVGLDRHFRAVVRVAQEVEPPRPAIAEVVGERRARQPVLPRAAARPQLADPRVRRRAEEAVARALLLVPVARGRGQPGLAHPVTLEQRREPIDEARLLVGALEPNVKVVAARDRDHPDAGIQELTDDRVGQEVAGRLQDDPDAALRHVLRREALDHLVRDALAHRIDQRLAARQDDASGLLGERPVGPRVVLVEVGHARGEMVDDARVVRLRLAHDGVQLAADVRPETFLVAVPALAVAGPGHHVVDRFHALSRSIRAELG